MRRGGDGALARPIAVEEPYVTRPCPYVLRGKGLAAKDECLEVRDIRRLDELNEGRSEKGPGDAKVVDDVRDTALSNAIVGHTDAGAYGQSREHLHNADVERIRGPLEHPAAGRHVRAGGLGPGTGQETVVLHNAAFGVARRPAGEDDIQGIGGRNPSLDLVVCG